MNDKRESALWIMNADGSRNRFLVKGSARAGRRRRPHRVHRARASRGARRSSCAGWTPKARPRRSRASSSRRRPSRGRPTASSSSFTHARSRSATRGRSRCPRRPRGAKWTEAPRIVEQLQLPARPQRLHRQRLPSPLRRPGDGGTPRQITVRRLRSRRHRVDARRHRASSSAACAAENADYQWRESEIYAVDVATGDDPAAHDAQGTGRQPAVSPDGKRVAYTGYDWTDDTWVDSKLYVMNIDGSNPRLVSGDSIARPPSLTWAADGSGLYFTAQNEGSQNLYYFRSPLARRRSRRSPRARTCSPVTDISPKGIAVGTLTSAARSRATSSRFDLKTPAAIKQLTAVNEDVLAGKKLGDGQGDLVHVGRRHEDPGLDRQAARLRSVAQVSAACSQIHGGPHACTTSASTSAGRSTRPTATSCSTRIRAAAPATAAPSATRSRTRIRARTTTT